MLQDDDRHVPVRICGGGRARFADGGLATAADDVRGAGRNGDDMVVHVNRREFDEMRQRWGDPTINPDTGLPEFWLGDLWDKAKDVWDDTKDWIVPLGAAAAGAFAPAIGGALGNALPGVANLLGTTGTQALATGLLGAGAGYLANGGQGALMGGLGGALGAYGGDLWRDGMEGSTGQLLTNLAAAGGLGGASGGGGGGEGAGMGSGALLPALIMAGVNMAGAAAQDDQKLPSVHEDPQSQMDNDLPTWENKRRRRNYSVLPDYTKEGEREYFEENRLAKGGRVRGHVKAGRNKGDGRSDNVKALLSPNEYVVDAETLALLGNGSPEAGAAAMDSLRANIRKHKGSALAQGAISPNALPPEQYLG